MFQQTFPRYRLLCKDGNDLVTQQDMDLKIINLARLALEQKRPGSTFELHLMNRNTAEKESTHIWDGQKWEPEVKVDSGLSK